MMTTRNLFRTAGAPNTIYLGSCSGGVFKTVDSGQTWKKVLFVDDRALGAYGEAPREVLKEEIAAARKEVDAFLAQFNALLASDVPAFNKTAAEQGVPPLFVGEAISVQPPAGF
jgi:hypothetical protein